VALKIGTTLWWFNSQGWCRMKNRQFKQVIVLTVGAVALASPLLAFASAQDIKDIAQNVTSNFSALSKLVTASGYVGGAVGVYHGLHKLWQKSHDQGGQIKFMQYAIPIGVGGAFIVMSATMGVPVATLFGGGVNSTAAGDSGTTTY